MRLISVDRCPISGRPGKPLYSNVEDAFFDTTGKWTYLKDDQSGHLWLDPRPDDDDIPALYGGYYTHEEASASERTLWERTVGVALHDALGYEYGEPPDWRAWLLSRVPSVRSAAELEVMRIPAVEQGSLLDYGCGAGAFLKRMRSHGWNVVGVEPDASSAARVAEVEGLNVFSSIDEMLMSNERLFDVIAMSHVIEHLPDPIGIIKRLRGVLAPGGRIIVTTPNARGLGARIFARNWRGLEPPRHLNVFTMQSLKSALEAGGFRIKVLRTDVRLARGIWFLSVLAREGRRGIEIHPRPTRRILKTAGYLFQLIEAVALVLNSQSGEELYCSAVAGNES